ncbi:MAG TPA: tetratricopeptide repeat protein [Pirellulales bacterium]|nr:tetratricopeptide repeat protein [Pirellulales bacterium]
MQTATINRGVGQPAKQARLRRRVLNIRLLVRSAAATAVMAILAYFWHGFQIDRNATALLDRAAQMEQSENWLGAAQSIHRFLRLRPDDVDAKIRLAEDFDQAAATTRDKTRAVELYATAIGLAPERADLRNRHLTLLLESGDYSAALRYADEMLEREPEGAPALRVRALAQLDQLQIRGDVAANEVAKSLEAAIELNPNDIQLGANLARLYRASLQSGDQGDQVMDRLVERAGDQAAALLARYAYRRQFGLPGADDDLDLALAKDVDAKDLDIRLAAAIRAQEAEDWGQSLKYYQDAVRIDKRDRRGYLGLGLAYREQGKIKEALVAWRSGLSNIGGPDLVMLTQIAAAEIELRQWEAAQKNLKSIERLVEGIFGREQSAWLATIDSLQAEMLIAQDECREAIPLLKKAIMLRQAGAETKASIAADAKFYAALGQCHARLMQWDQAATSYQKAADLRPSETVYRISAAAAWASAGRLDEASRQYEQALSGDRGTASAWGAYAQVAFRQQLTALEPNWPEFERILAQAQAKTADSNAGPEEILALKLLDAEFLLHRQKFEEAFALLKTVETEFAAAPELAARLIFDYERLGRQNDADRALGEFEKRPENSLRSVYVWADLLTSRKQFDKAERRLSDALAAKLTNEERFGLVYRLAILDLSQGKSDAARKKLEELAGAAPKDRRVPALLAEMALARGDLPNAEKWEQRLRDILGEEDALWRYYRAQRLIYQFAKTAPDDQKARQRLIDEATKLQAEAERLRPNWGAAYLLKAKLALLGRQPDSEAAVRAYIQSIRLGETRLQVYESLISLLYQQNRIAEAATYLNRLRDATELPAELTTMAMAIDVRQGNLARALESARREVEQHPDDATRRLWLGQLLALESPADDDAEKGKQKEEAEAQIKRAKELSPKDLRTWSALLSFYAGTKQVDAGRKLLAELEQSDTVADSEQAFVLAQGYALLGDRDRAKSLYLDAVKRNTDSVYVQLQAAGYFLQTDLDLAKQCVNRVLQLEPNHETARNLSALLRFSEGGTEEELEEVYKLLDRNRDDDALSVSGQRLKALMLVRRGGENSRRRAREVLEALVDVEGTPTDIDRLLLARLYEAQGQTVAAAEQLKALVNRDKPSASHLVAYVDFLLRTEQATEAGYSLDQLAKLEPEGANWRTLTLRARWLKARGEAPKIPPLVQRFLNQTLANANDPAQQATLWLNAGKLYSSLSLEPEAESSYREAVQLEPRTLPALAMWLAQHGKSAEAIRSCIASAKSDLTSQTARTLSSILVIAPLPAELRTDAEAVLSAALERHPEDAQLLFDIATLRLFKGDNGQAIRLLRQTLQFDPKNLQAMNNLAILLAGQPQGHAEAIEYIDRAISLAGMHPELLDSKAWILLCHGEAAAAETLLHDALSIPPGDARHHFHLALACQLQGKLDDARNSLQKARDGKLPVNLLMPDELSRLHSLEQALR